MVYYSNNKSSSSSSSPVVGQKKTVAKTKRLLRQQWVKAAMKARVKAEYAEKARLAKVVKALAPPSPPPYPYPPAYWNNSSSSSSSSSSVPAKQKLHVRPTKRVVISKKMNTTPINKKIKKRKYSAEEPAKISRQKRVAPSVTTTPSTATSMFPTPTTTPPMAKQEADDCKIAGIKILEVRKVVASIEHTLSAPHGSSPSTFHFGGVSWNLQQQNVLAHLQTTLMCKLDVIQIPSCDIHLRQDKKSVHKQIVALSNLWMNRFGVAIPTPTAPTPTPSPTIFRTPTTKKEEEEWETAGMKIYGIEEVVKSIETYILPSSTNNNNVLQFMGVNWNLQHQHVVTELETRLFIQLDGITIPSCGVYLRQDKKSLYKRIGALSGL